MTKVRMPKKEIEVRLQTVEERLEEIFGRIGLLDEQTRQAGYHAYLAMVQLGQTGRTPLTAEERRDATEEGRNKLEALTANLARIHQRVGKTASKRAAHSSR
ncbi:MAG TPA: hypothetical protein VKS22_14935 [Candidatus Binataceae bacterium]|nr:hypothetical protein [Candidatus Binataceae bacterium]